LVHEEASTHGGRTASDPPPPLVDGSVNGEDRAPSTTQK
jgi:hypothetical protein